MAQPLEHSVIIMSHIVPDTYTVQPHWHAAQDEKKIQLQVVLLKWL